jgi:non-heme chloroperoxidase
MLVRVMDGVNLHVEDVGAGPPVVLIHGWSLNHRAWERQIEVLAAAGHRVLALDLRGHGDSDAGEDGCEIERLAEDVTAVLKARHVESAVLVGWSLGGLVALRVAATVPGSVRRLVLVASNGVAHARQERFPFGISPQTVLPSFTAGERRDREASRRRILLDGFGVVPDAGVLDRLLTMSLQTQTPAALACLKTLLLTDQVDLLDRVRVPVVQILGAKDPGVSLSGAAWLCDQLQATQVVLPCGHYPMLEVPEDFDRALLAAVHT